MYDLILGRAVELTCETCDAIVGANFDRAAVTADLTEMIFRQACDDDQSDALLEIGTRHGKCRVVRYDIKSAIVASTSLVAGATLTIVGTVATIAGLWALMDIRKPLPLGQVVIVWILATAEGHEVAEATLREKFDPTFRHLFGAAPPPSAYDISIDGLERAEVVLREMSNIVLQDAVYVNADLSLFLPL